MHDSAKRRQAAARALRRGNTVRALIRSIDARANRAERLLLRALARRREGRPPYDPWGR